MVLINGNSNGKIIRMPDLDYTPDPRGLGYAFYESMLQYKNNLAQIDGITGEKDTYASLLQRCVRTAITMRLRGVTPDDIITTCSYNHLNSCVPYIATLFLGTKLACVDPSQSVADMVQLLNQTKPKIIFAVSESESQIEEVVKEIGGGVEIVIFGDTARNIPFSDFLRPCKEENDFKPVQVKDPKETAIIFFSSGTTGLPKGICINHSGFLSQIVNTVRFGYCQDITYCPTTLYGITATMFLATTIVAGKARLLLSKFEPTIVWEAIGKYKPTLIIALPGHVVALYNAGRPYDVDVSSVKHLGIGGSPLLKQQILNTRKMFPAAQVLPGYGQTEVAMMLTNFKPCKPEEFRFIYDKPTSCGTGIPGLSYKIVDIETEEILGPNQEGELRLKTQFDQLNGYYKIDSPDIWDGDGWFKTGDMVYYDEDGCFFVVDRIKELLKYKMWHVPPAMIEGVLMMHPAVAAAVVVGIPDDEDGDLPAAAVVLKKSAKNVTPDDIAKYVEERVDDRKKLRGGVRFVDNIPLAHSGKVKRREIRDMMIRGEI